MKYLILFFTLFPLLAFSIPKNYLNVSYVFDVSDSKNADGLYAKGKLQLTDSVYVFGDALAVNKSFTFWGHTETVDIEDYSYGIGYQKEYAKFLWYSGLYVRNTEKEIKFEGRADALNNDDISILVGITKSWGSHVITDVSISNENSNWTSDANIMFKAYKDLYASVSYKYAENDQKYLAGLAYMF